MTARLRYALAVATIGGVYLAVAKLALAAAVAQPVVSSAWPPAGIGLAILVLYGRRYWPGIALGAVLLNATSGVPLSGALAIGSGNTLEAVVGALLLERAAFRPALERLSDVVALVLAGMLSTVIGAGIGVTSLWLSGAAALSSLPTLGFVWWSGDCIGIIVFAPLLLTWLNAPIARPTRRRLTEVAAFLAVLIGVTMLLFSTRFSFVYALFPVAMWGALRFGPRGAASTAAIAATLAISYTLRQQGPFVTSSPLRSLFLLQSFILLLSLAKLVLAALIAERRQAQVALRSSEARLVRAQELAHLGNWELELTNVEDVAGNRLWWSEEVFRIFGFEPEATIVTPDLHASISEDDGVRFDDEIRAAVGEGRSYALERRIRRSDGSVRVVMERAEVVRDPRGRPTRLVGTVQDVTERYTLEERLRQSEKMEAIGRLAGGVAHDFNNILTAIRASADMLMKQTMSSDAKEEAEQIRTAVGRAGGLIRQLLTVGRRHVYTSRRIDLNEIVTNLDGMLRRLLPEQIELRAILAPDLHSVRADRVQIEQVILNLVVNARDAMLSGGGQLMVETRNAALGASFPYAQTQVKPGRYVMLSVTDTGAGMDQETRARIFEPFFSTKTDSQGTGLGLATVYSVVRQSNGYIWVDSEPGRGSTFRVYLPHDGAAH
ncbi:MAG TPA: MASE1 domain-containing protein [Gemmatimonadales bacterium]|nr:MASE1 domain-containing protein [Gemmatimonadales bacterium]